MPTTSTPSRPRSRAARAGAAASRLKAYHRKRKLQASGEPAGKNAVASSGLPRFVIQKHDATRLHYDLRLEMDGAYKSWAVPKGLPDTPGTKSLAVEVEDHPLDYGVFEGVIPPGNYGAGTVMVWDRGFYTASGGDPLRAYRQGKIHFALAGEKCEGEWTLVRLRAEEKDKVNWLLIKNRDRARGAPIKQRGRDLSVKTGRSLEEIATEEAPRVQKKKPVAAREKKPGEPPAPRRSASSSLYLEPMKALGVAAIPEGPWLLENKFDGYRALAILEKKARPELWSRNRKVFSDKYPEIVAALETLRPLDTVLDGEIVALDATGHPKFQLLQNLDQAGQRPPILYYVFDLLRLEGRMLIDEPIEERKTMLARFLKKAPSALRLSPVFDESPARLLEEVRRQGLEGIIAKAAGSRYEPGRRSGSWLKCRIAHEQELVIGGYTPPQGGRSHFGAILVGYYAGERLLYAGKIGTGFDRKSLAALHAKFTALETDQCPFANLPLPRKPRFGLGMTASAMREVKWLRPKLVCQARFSEWTRDGLLRQPVFLGLREDKTPHEVAREITAEES